jgi:hypothetical protein
MIDFTLAGFAAPVAAASMDNIVALKFSDNFQSDYTAIALSEDTNPAGAAGVSVLREHILNFNSFNWDTGVIAGYPVVFDSTVALNFNVVKADIALGPNYDGGDDSTRVVYVGASITKVAEAGGIWCIVDNNAPAGKIYGQTTSVGINSVAFDGTNLVAGAYLTNNVLRSSDLDSSAPTFRGATTLKRIGLDGLAGIVANDQVSVKFDVGYQTLYGAKLGDASALSKSTDYGATWNDYTLLDSALVVIDDIYMTPTGYPWYISGHDAVSSCVYRIDSPFGPSTRVLCVIAGPAFMLRGIDADTNVLYAAANGGLVMYYTANGGLTKWYQRNSIPAAITDVAAESATVVYIGSGINIYRSDYAGNTWNAPVNCKVAGDVVNTMVSLGAGKLLVGGTGGSVVWTTDGGTTWTASMGIFNTFGPVQVAATGLSTTDFVFASEEWNNQVWRCDLSPANFMLEFHQMNVAAAAPTTIGLMLKDGMLYALSTAAGGAVIQRSGIPTIAGTHIAAMWGTAYQEAGIVPAITSASALRVSSGAPGSIMLYIVAPGFFGPSVYYYDDNIALSGPALLGPANGTLVQIVSALTGAVQPVNFTLSRISLATSYLLQVALDAAFNRQARRRQQG